MAFHSFICNLGGWQAETLHIRDALRAKRLRPSTKTHDARSAGAVEVKIGKLIRDRRLKLGMSQEMLAAKIGVTFQQVQKYEKGINRVAFSRMLDIARVLDAKIVDFVPD